MIPSGIVYALGAFNFGVFTHRMRAPWLYGLHDPLGALVGAGIFVRSWLRGSRVEWKGRRHTLPAVSERP